MKNLIERVEKIPVYDANGNVRRYLNVNVTLMPDDITGEYCYTPEAQMSIDRAIATDADLPLPEEIRALRKRLGKSQVEMCRLLKLGDRTWARWETGAAIPDPVNRQQIRLLNTGGLSIYELEHSSEQDALSSWAAVLSIAVSPLIYGLQKSSSIKTHFCYEYNKGAEVHETKAVVLAA